MRFLLALLLAGCAAGTEKDPPRQYSIDGEFSPEQATVIEDAVTAWCDAGKWCPERVTWTKRGRFAISHDYAALPFVVPGSDAFNDQDNVWYDAEGLAFLSPEVLWVVSAHEGGHFGVTGHPVQFPHLMADKVGTVSTKPEVDAESAAAWCNEGCR